MARYRKRPVVIDAVLWDGQHVVGAPDWFPPIDDRGPNIGPGQVSRFSDRLFVGTLEGVMTANPGDWIIRGVAGEIYPCKPDIFAAIYEPAE